MPSDERTSAAANRPLSARDAAARVGVAERTVRRWIGSGDLAAEKQGGRYLIRPEDVDAAFARSRAATGVEQAEWKGRYIEAKERLEQAEAELAREREQRIRLELVLYPPRRTELGGMTAASSAEREARAVRGCQVLKQQLDAANAKLSRVREDYEMLARWAGEHADDDPWAEQVVWHTRARLDEWHLPVERWEP